MKSRIASVLLVFAFLASAVSTVAAPPRKKAAHPFQSSPAKMFPTLKQLETVSDHPITLSKDETSLFGDSADGKLEKFSFGEACLIASGVTDAEKRAKYLAQLDKIEADARKALAECKSDYDKAKKLLEVLHDGPMAKGYSTNQTNLHVVLDTGTFNCVSSAMLYNVIGSRLGLKLRAVEIPNHAFSLLIDGDRRIDVETTNKHGFDPKRDAATAKKMTKPGGEAYDPRKHDAKRREISDLELIALMCSNQAVELARNGHVVDAIVASVRTLCFDPDHEQAAKNVVAHLVNWANDLERKDKFEESLTVLRVGLELVPNENSLLHNSKVTYERLAASTMKAGKEDAALAVIRRAGKIMSASELTGAESDLFLRHGEELIKDRKWEDAVALANRAMSKVNAMAGDRVRDWRNGIYLRWSQEYTDKNEFEKALAILKQGKKADAKEMSFDNNTLAIYDAWAGKYMDKKDWSGAIRIYQVALKEMPGNCHLKNNLAYCEQEAKK